MLGAVKTFGSPISSATYLAAHRPPSIATAQAYVDLVSDELMGRVVDEGLAGSWTSSAKSPVHDPPYLRVRKNAGSPRSTPIRSLDGCFAPRGSGCVSADHLEQIDEGGIAALSRAGIVAGLLGCSFYLGVPQAGAATPIPVPVAFATSTTRVFHGGISSAGSFDRLYPDEPSGSRGSDFDRRLTAGELGRIEEGLEADLVILDVPSVDRWLSEMGSRSVRTVLKRGRVVHESSRS
jgi:hypothetical protein